MSDREGRQGPTLSEYLSQLQDELQSSLRRSQVLTHPVAKGDETELAWNTLLDGHLPRRYEVMAKAFAVDHTGCVSDEIDLIVADRQYSPLAMQMSGRTIVPIEAVYAGIEVKPQLNKANVEYAGEKVASLRRLTRTSAPIVDARGLIDPPREPPRILGLLLTSDCDWASLASTSFAEAVATLDEDAELDLGCVANHGAWEASYVVRPPILTTWPVDEGLFRFWLQLLSALQRMGTVPAMDYGAWGRSDALSSLDGHDVGPLP